MAAVTIHSDFGAQENKVCHCGHKIKRHLFLGRKAVTNLDSILKSRDISLPTIVRLGFPVVMHGG